MDDEPVLGVGFAIDTGNSIDQLKQVMGFMESAEYKAYQSAQKIEQATSGMINLGAATMQIKTFASTYERASQEVGRSANQIERSGEGLIRSLTRQAETFGMTAAQARQYRIEQQAMLSDKKGLTEQADRLRALGEQFKRLETNTGGVTNAAVKNRMAMQGAAYQFQDFATQVSMGANPLNAFAVQGAQLAGQLSILEGKVGAVARFFMGPWGLAITGGVLALSMLTKGMFDNSEAAKKKEAAAKDLVDQIDKLYDANMRAVKSEQRLQQETLNSAYSMWQKAEATRLATIETLKAAKAELRLADANANSPGNFGSADEQIAALRDVTQAQSKVAAIDAELAKNSTTVAKTWASVQAARIPILKGMAEEASRATAATREYDRATDALTDRLIKGTISGAAYRDEFARLKAAHDAEQEALEKAGQKKKTATDRTVAHQQALARGAEAVGAQTRNLYALADAYGVSGAAALAAEARVKAESAAIKARGDIEGAVQREVQLAIAQRVTDAARATAGMNDQIAAQRRANDAIAAGLIPTAQAAQFAQEQIADLPLLAALQAAQQRGLAVEVTKATAALDAQRKARAELRAEEGRAKFNTALATGADRLAELREELRLVGATDDARRLALATLKATRDSSGMGADAQKYIDQQRDIANLTSQLAIDQEAHNSALTFAADKWDLIARNVQNAGRGMADAFGEAGRAIGGMASIFADFAANRARLDGEHATQMAKFAGKDAALAREQQKYALATATSQIGLYGDMTAAAKGFFSEKSKGYQAMMAAEKVFRAFEFAMSIRSMAQDVMETISSLTNSTARATAAGAEGVAQQSKLPFPLNIAAMAATAAALVAAGIAVFSGSGGGGGSTLEPGNEGRGTVFGDSKAQSDSIKRSIDQLREVDTVMLTYSREMASSLRSIDAQIGGFTNVILRQGDINASGGIAQGFKANVIGSVLGAIPLIGGMLKGLFGSTTKVIGSGIQAGPQSLGGILTGGFAGSSYSDIEKKSKFLGFTTGKKYSTQYGALDQGLEDQFTLILKGFNDAIVAAAGPLGASTGTIQQKLNGFIVDIGKIDLKGLSGEQIEERLSAVFGAAADKMAAAAFPGFERFQRVGEGLFETLVRVASTMEVVTASMDQLGFGARALSIDTKLAIAAQFESLSAMSSAVDGYIKAYYSREEQNAATLAQFGKVFASLGVAMPGSLSAFRALVEAQNLNTAAGRETYATLLQLAPAFADLQNAMNGAKSAADVLAERQDLERKMLELQGNTAALRELELAKLDASNRALQQQIWAMEDAKEAARAADELRKAWQSVGDTIRDEIDRIRGLNSMGGDGSFAAIMGQFNAAMAATRGGDIDAGKALPGLSQALLRAAELQATSRQELDRIRAQTAASLESVLAQVNGSSGSGGTPKTTEALLSNMAAIVSVAQDRAPANDDLKEEMRGLRDEMVGMRRDNNAGHAATAGNTGAVKRHLDNVTMQSGGDALSTVQAA